VTLRTGEVLFSILAGTHPRPQKEISTGGAFGGSHEEAYLRFFFFAEFFFPDFFDGFLEIGLAAPEERLAVTLAGAMWGLESARLAAALATGLEPDFEVAAVSEGAPPGDPLEAALLAGWGVAAGGSAAPGGTTTVLPFPFFP
jgi:hypothetical protein